MTTAVFKNPPNNYSLGISPVGDSTVEIFNSLKWDIANMLASVTDDNSQFIIKTMLLLITLRQNNRQVAFFVEH